MKRTVIKEIEMLHHVSYGVDGRSTVLTTNSLVTVVNNQLYVVNPSRLTHEVIKIYKCESLFKKHYEIVLLSLMNDSILTITMK
jgi:hypothetical protein